jgi:hypothetical protein
MDVLKKLNFQQSDFSLPKANVFEYVSDLGSLSFIKMESNEELDQQFYDAHRDIWNENKSEIFVAIIDESNIIICDSKTRPKRDDPIKEVKIKSFGYGENTEEAQNYRELLKKENIDNGVFWEDISKFIREREKRKIRSPIDENLLDNLIKTREKLQKIIKNDTKNISQKLIDRCLFIRFIEDRLGSDKLKQVLKEPNVDQLLSLFKYYNEALNGDLFDEDDIPITDSSILNELDKVFGEYYVYSNGQRTLTPYKFDKIPILLISHIYQKFLKKDKKDREGIVFTPENIVDFMVSTVFGSQDIVDKAQKGKIKILDSACGSGIFLVKSFERLLTERQRYLKKQLNIHEKTNLLKESIYGIDLDQDALRVAAFSLYLKIFEGINSKTIKKEVFDRYEQGLEHFMFPGLKEKNLINANALFDEVFDDGFDLILGNPPWGYKFDDGEKQKIGDKWGKTVSQYQSSQCFLHQTKVWMNEDTIVGMVVNISNFTNTRAGGFRAKLLKTYSILNFTTLTKVKDITFEESDEPACILIFTLKKAGSEIEFLIPELTQFSKLTGTITIRNDDKFKFLQKRLKDDVCWHISLLGLNRYLDLIEKIENKNDFFENVLRDDNNYCHNLDYYSMIKKGACLYTRKTHGDIESAKRKYESNEKLGMDYYPMIRSTKAVQPFLFKKNDFKYIKYGSHLERERTIELFEGDKLVITRSWPLKAVYVKDTIIFSDSFNILKLRGGVNKNYLLIFEAILNSKLGFFYLDSLYRQRPEGNFSKVNKDSLERFPIPNLEDKGNIVEDIVKTIGKIRSGKNIEENRRRIDELVFDLYDLDYYEKMQISDYYNLQNRRRRSLVTEKDFDEYIGEFQNSFSFLIKEGYTLNTEDYICDFLGALIKFSFSKEKVMPQHNRSKSLKKLIEIIQRDKLRIVDIKSMLEEKKVKIYNENRLIIYKSNHLRDWTRTEAMNDVKEEIGVIYNHLPE